MLIAATQGVADAKRSHGRSIVFCAKAAPAGFIARAKRTTVSDRMCPNDKIDLGAMGYSQVPLLCLFRFSAEQLGNGIIALKMGLSARTLAAAR